MAKPKRSTATIAQALGGIDFPCRKQRLVDYARAHNADREALDLLRGLPDETYGSMADVFKRVGRAPRRAEGRPMPTEEPEPATLEGEIGAVRPHPAQPVQPRPEHRRRKGFLAGLRRALGLD